MPRHAFNLTFPFFLQGLRPVVSTEAPPIIFATPTKLSSDFTAYDYAGKNKVPELQKIFQVRENSGTDTTEWLVILTMSFLLIVFACLILKFIELLEVGKALLGLLINREKPELDFRILLMLIYIQIIEKSVAQLHLGCHGSECVLLLLLEASFPVLRNLCKFRTGLGTFGQVNPLISDK